MARKYLIWHFPGPSGRGLAGTVVRVQAGQPKNVTPPGDLRPAQLGIVLRGRATLGHVSATLVDLAQRGFLTIEEVDGSPGPDWRLTDLRQQAAGHCPLLPFEVTLLNGMFARQSVVLLSEIDNALVPALDRFRVLVRRDAVRNGRLSRWRRGKRSPGGERLLRQIQEFRRELRVLAASSDPAALAGLVPYAMIIGRGTPSPAALNDASDTGTTQGREADVPRSRWPRPDLFAAGWMAACARLSYHPGQGHQPDFAHAWSAPAGHDGHSRHSGHGDYGGGYGHHGGGFGDHGGGFGGGHSGH
jgi:uncharacterized membrane protein YgcG